MAEGLLYKLPHTVHLPCCYDKIVRLLPLQHQPHSLKETETERSNNWEIIKTVRRSTLDRAQLSPDRQEVNLRPLSGAFAHTSALTSLRGSGDTYCGKGGQSAPTGPLCCWHTKMHTWPWMQVQFYTTDILSWRLRKIFLRQTKWK